MSQFPNAVLEILPLEPPVEYNSEDLPHEEWENYLYFQFLKTCNLEWVNGNDELMIQHVAHSI